MVAAAGILMFAGCKRGEQVAPLNTIYATVASHSGVNPSGGKSYIDGNSVCWSEGDKIALITTDDKDERIEYILSSGSGTTSGEFLGKNPSAQTGPYCVVYPYSSVTGSSFSDDGVFTVYDTLPREQSYSKNSFGEGANLSIGYSSNDYNFKFLNVMGVLKVTIKNAATCFVEKVELVSMDPADKLWGDGTVKISGSTANNPSVELTGGSNVLTLGRCMKWEKGDVSLYFVVPAGTLQSGFEIKIYEYGYKDPITKGKTGEAIEFTNPNGQNVIQRNTVSVLDFADSIPTKGYVDLGEAGMWAQCNYGADNPYEPGGYYQFGGMVNVFGLGKGNGEALRGACPFLKDSTKVRPNKWIFNKYNSVDNCVTLCSDDDVVASGIGKDWCIPDNTKLEDLCLSDKCTFEETYVNGVKGVLVKNEASGNYMFLPACGYWGWWVNPYNSPDHIDSGSVYIGSKSVHSSEKYACIAGYFENGKTEFVIKSSTFYRVFGVQIRPAYVGPN